MAALPAKAATVIAESRFDGDADGWRNGDFTGGNTTYDVTWNAAGFISVGDDHGQFSAFLAPAKFRGDRHDAIGGSLSFDLASDYPVFPGPLPYVTLQGHGVLLFGLITEAGPGQGFSRFTVDLRPENFFAGSPEDGPDLNPVSARVFAQVLSDVRQLSIRADIAEGADLARLDNVVLSTGPGLPEPSTWTVLILGFGLSGAALRAQRRTETARGR